MQDLEKLGLKELRLLLKPRGGDIRMIAKKLKKTPTTVSMIMNEHPKGSYSLELIAKVAKEAKFIIMQRFLDEENKKQKSGEERRLRTRRKLRKVPA